MNRKAAGLRRRHDGHGIAVTQPIQGEFLKPEFIRQSPACASSSTWKSLSDSCDHRDGRLSFTPGDRPISASRRSVHRSQDGGKPRLQPATPVRVVMRKHIKFVLPDGCKHLRGYFRWVKSRLDPFGDLRRK
jgi:hypothetical protein